MRRKSLVFISFIALLIVSVFLVGTAAASSGTTISVDPPTIWDPTMGPGTQFTIEIVVDDVENLWAYQIELSFNPDVIHGVSYENGPFLESKGGSAEFVPGEGFDNTEGKLALFGAYLDPMVNYAYGSDGVLATVTFEVVGYGKSSILLGDATGLTDAEGKWIIPESLEAGHFANAKVHDVAVTRISTHTYYCCQGDPIYITVIVENLGDFTETFDVEVYSVPMGGSGEEISIGIEAVEDLVAGDTDTLFFAWDTTEVSVGSYHIYAEANGVPGESAWTANNIISTPFGGICVKPHEATLMELVVSWLSFVVKAGLPVAVFVTIAVVFFKAMTSVSVPRLTRLWKRA